MNPVEKRGRVYLLAFVIVLIVTDILFKGLLLAAGGLRWSQAIGTGMTLLTCWFLWRGSSIAYGVMVFCMVLAGVFLLFASGEIPLVLTAVIGLVIVALLFALFAPATRKFVAYQRAAARA